MAAAAHRALSHRWRFLVALAILIAAVWLFRAATAPEAPLLPAGVLRVGVDPSNPPFAFYADEQIHGLEIELAQALAQTLDVPVQLVPLGFDGLYDAIKVEQVDIVIAALTPDPLRTADVIYSSPYYDDGLVLVSPADQPIDVMELLSGHSLAYPFGSEADAEAHRWLRRIEPFATKPYETPEIALDAVRLGTASAALVQATDARVYAHAHADWQQVQQAVTHTPFVIATSAKNGRLAGAIDTSLRQLQMDGTLAAILDRWL
ncbi:MAG: amino acid ABC transporter substrate-binding protein [Anaerolineae bacterium]|nr:amino acid ABC transporter substrate-binding protein [Anaerolineae bacterium]